MAALRHSNDNTDRIAKALMPRRGGELIADHARDVFINWTFGVCMGAFMTRLSLLGLMVEILLRLGHYKSIQDLKFLRGGQTSKTYSCSKSYEHILEHLVA
jgi:hypothetical protein